MNKNLIDRNRSRVQDERFGFGENWNRFLRVLDDERISEAEESLKSMLDSSDLKDKTFLDIGSGSGLFSLVARRLGMNVHSFDYDSQSVACTAELKRRYFAEDRQWTVEQGSAIDNAYMSRLGKFDVVYSWGVLHHTGAMWLGIEHTINRVDEGGILFIAIYNDQGWKSRFWWFIKFFYNKLPRPLNTLYAYSLGIVSHIMNIIKYTIMFKPMTAIRPLLKYKQNRGMSLSHDLVDWMGGFPYEFAQYEVLVEYLRSRGFEFVKGNKATSLGCHELIFKHTKFV